MSDINKRSLSDYHIESIKELSRSHKTSAEDKTTGSILTTGLVVVLLYWIADAGVYTLFFSEDTFLNLLVLKPPIPLLYGRCVVSILIVIMTFLTYRVAQASSLDRALKRSSKWFSTTLKSIGAALLAVDKDGNVIFMNPMAQQLTSWKLQNAVGEPLAHVCNIVDAKSRKDRQFRKKLKEVIQDGIVYTLDNTSILQAADGREPYVAGTAAPIKDEEGEIIGGVLVLQDLTQFKLAEEAVLRLATVVDQADDLIFITDVHGTVQYVNPGFERVTGYQPNEIIGIHIDKFTDYHAEAAFVEKLRLTLETNEGWRDRFTFKHKEGQQLRLESWFSPIIDPSGEVINYVCVSHDITREVELQKQLNHSQKMEAVGRLAGGVAHDFNNLLTVISGFNDLIMEEVQDDESLLENAKEVSTAVEAAMNLTGMLLTFSRKDVFKPVVLDPNKAIQNMENILDKLVSTDVKLALSLVPDARTVKVDPAKLNQVLMNLVVNASQAMPVGGEIKIETQCINFKPGSGDHPSGLKPGEYFVLTVADNGMGMDRATMTHVFEPFFTTKDAGKGTGLGLSLVYGFIKQVAGEIKVESKENVGTTFKLYIPVCTESRAAISDPDSDFRASE